MEENNWISERVKTWIVIITMTLLIGGMLGGMWKAQQWKAEVNDRERIEMIQQESSE